MTDLETRLVDGLAGTAERAPHAADLAAGARGRLRRRRRTTAAVVAACLAVVAVPVGLAVVGGPADDADDSSVAETPADWRTETWHDLSLRVPPDWTYVGGLDWCVAGTDAADVTPAVSRPGGVTRSIRCRPSYGYGARFLQPSGGELPPGTEGAVQRYHGDTYPDGAWIGYVSTTQAAAWVVTPDRTTTRLVLDSAEPVGEVDDNGCPARQLGTILNDGDRMVVCRYDGLRLVQSERLSADETVEALAALRAAPEVERRGIDMCGDTPTEAVRMVGGGVAAVVVPRCRTVSLPDGPRRLTPEVLYWALSPGWSGSMSFLTYDKDPEPLELRRP